MGAGFCVRRAPSEVPPALPPPRTIRPCPKCSGANRYCQSEAFEETGSRPEDRWGTERRDAAEAGGPVFAGGRCPAPAARRGQDPRALSVVLDIRLLIDAASALHAY